MPPSPVVRTLLFTDIEGSTGLWERQADMMAAALAQHDRLSRAAVEAHRGQIWKATGDGLCAAFDDPLDALNAALAFARALDDPAAFAELRLKVRFGLHLGAVEQREADFVGAAVNRAAQIMNAAHGGQIVASRAVVEQIEERLPAGVSLRDFGRVRLKDLATPEHLYQMQHPSLAAEFPPLRSLEATPNNLPQQVTSFVGRERELAQAGELLAGTRLLTLLGMGGLGKTRLAMQVAAERMHDCPDGVWFVDLGAIVDAALVVGAAAQVLGVREEAGRPLLQTLCAQLRPWRTIMILDNCEHLLPACAGLAAAALAAAPQLRIVATSREPLRIDGEQIMTLRPLALPARDAGLEALLRSEAVQLFVERARLQKPGYALTEKDAPAVAEICARLEGIPLALELAAARMRALSVQDINARLNDRFRLLTRGSRVALERQQTLRALVAWSYDLLGEAEKRLLDRLAVFVGGFDLAAAEAVCGAAPIDAADVLDLLASLVEKSLVMLDERDEGGRYRMLETIRDFAREQLAQRGDDAAATAARHCAHYFALAKAGRDGLKGGEQARWIRRLETDIDNLRSATTLALAGAVDPFIAVKIAVALMGFWMLRGYAGEGRAVVRAALALPAVQESDRGRAWALYVGAALARSQGEHVEARQMLEACLELRRGLGDPVEIAATLSTLAQARLQAGDPQGANDAESEALQMFREQGDRIGEAIGRLHLGQVALYEGDTGRAQAELEEALAVARDIDHREVEGESERLLGEAAFASGDLAAATARFAASLAICRDAADRQGEANALRWLGKADLERGDSASARKRLAAALRALEACQMREEMVGCVEDFAALDLAEGQGEAAAELAAAADQARIRLALVRSPLDERRWQAMLERLRAAVDGAPFDAAWQRGARWETQQAVNAALAAQRAAVG